MKKNSAVLAISALVALACTASASPVKSGPSDAQETALLPENLKAFSKFCLSSRDLILREGAKEMGIEKTGRGNSMTSGVDKIMATCDELVWQAGLVRDLFEEFKETLLRPDSDALAKLDLSAVPCLSLTQLVKGEEVCAKLRGSTDHMRSILTGAH